MYDTFWNKLLFLIMKKDSNFFKNDQDKTFRFQTLEALQSYIKVDKKHLIEKPDIESMEKNGNVFEQLANYALLESYYKKNPTEERGGNLDEILNHQKAKINTKVLVNLQVNFSSML